MYVFFSLQRNQVRWCAAFHNPVSRSIRPGKRKFFMFNVTFHPAGKQVQVEQGENLLRAAMLAGVQFSASCGGSGSCGKCKVLVEKGEFEFDASARISATDQEKGYALACTTRVNSDIEVRLPEDARAIDRQAIERAMLTSVEPSELLGDIEINPSVQRVYLELPPPSLEDNVSDVDRLTRALEKQLGSKKIHLSLPVIKQASSILRSSGWKATFTIFCTDDLFEVTQAFPGNRTEPVYGLAVDIGTTTICAELVNLENGLVQAQRSDYNSQHSCGEDVISRIVYASRNRENLAHIQGLAHSTLNGLVQEMLNETGVNSQDIADVVMSGNTTMTHLFMGVEPGIREEPYVPVTSAPPVLQAGELSLEWSDSARIYLTPSRASYMGGDITAGLIGSNLFRSEKLTLYIDVGTNGEIVLGGSEWLIGCSCSAGPAFEGGAIKHGMRAATGAVEQVRIDPGTFEPMILTVGQSSPRGICGSGLIDAMAELLMAGVITSKGRFNTELDTPRIRGQEALEYVLVWAEDAHNGQDIVITEGDLDNLLRAKAAVFAGITTLLNAVGITLQDVDELLIAGGFGRYLELDKAVTIGLLPEISPDRVKYIGNGSLLGSRVMLLSRRMRQEALQVCKKMTYLELSQDPSFMDQYVSALFMPHTDMSMFPSVQAGLMG